MVSKRALSTFHGYEAEWFIRLSFSITYFKQGLSHPGVEMGKNH